MTSRDISRLPVWAQDLLAEKDMKIARLTQNLEAADPGDSTVFANPHSDFPRPLGKDTHVRFANKDVFFDARFDSEEGVLTVTAIARTARTGGLAIYPEVSNSIRLKGSGL
jgi:hypothetical protein